MRECPGRPKPLVVAFMVKGNKFKAGCGDKRKCGIVVRISTGASTKSGSSSELARVHRKKGFGAIWLALVACNSPTTCMAQKRGF